MSRMEDCPNDCSTAHTASFKTSDLVSAVRAFIGFRSHHVLEVETIPLLSEHNYHNYEYHGAEYCHQVPWVSSRERTTYPYDGAEDGEDHGHGHRSIGCRRQLLCIEVVALGFSIPPKESYDHDQETDEYEDVSRLVFGRQEMNRQSRYEDDESNNSYDPAYPDQPNEPPCLVNENDFSDGKSIEECSRRATHSL